MDAEGLVDYPELERRAAQDPPWFWNALLRHLDIRFRRPYATVLDQSAGPPWPKWCVGGTMNMTESLLDRHLAAGRGAHPAVVWEGEDGSIRTLSYAELSTQVNRVASGIESLGLRPGDAVGVYPPVPASVARVADVERMQMLIESPSRVGLRRLLAAWLPKLHALRSQRRGADERILRWAVDVDPLAI